MSRALLVIAVCLLAGCASGSPKPGASHGDASPGHAPPEGAAAGLVPASFPHVEARDQAIWANGTLTPQQANRAPGAPAGNPAGTSAVSVDVTKLAVPGIPLILEGDFQSGMTKGSAFAFFNIPNADFRNGAFGQPSGGKHHVEQGLVRTTSEPITLNLFYDEAEPAAEVPYTLSAHVHVDPTLVRAAFPVGVTVTNATHELVIDLVGEKRSFAFDLDTPNLMVWGPDDAFLGHFPLKEARTTIPLPAGAEGECVLILSQGGRSMRVLTPGPEPARLRAMSQKFEVSDPHSDATPQKVEWTKTYAKPPVLVGVFFSPSAVSTDVSVKLASPAGVIIDGTSPGPWLNAPLPTGGLSASFGWDSAYGVPLLVAGEYHVSITAPNAVGSDPIRAQDFWAVWTR